MNEETKIQGSGPLERAVGLRARYARKFRAEKRCTQCAAPADGVHSYCEACRHRRLDRLAKKRGGARWVKGKRGRPPKQPNVEVTHPETKS